MRPDACWVLAVGAAGMHVHGGEIKDPPDLSSAGLVGRSVSGVETLVWFVLCNSLLTVVTVPP